MKKQNSIVEYDLEASMFNYEIAPGKTIKAWGFNKQLPGPVLEANAGDTLVVRVTNNLNEPTMRTLARNTHSGGQWMEQVWCKNQLNRVNLLNIVLLFLMPELSGTTLIKMKQYKWKEACMVL